MTQSELEAERAQKAATYQKRARLGTLVLGLRTAVAQVIILLGTVVLARHLRPAEFGTFAMVQFALTVFTLIVDVGFGGALIQKSSQPDERELSTVFWTQLGLSAGVFGLVAATGTFLPTLWPSLPRSAPLLLLALAFNFVLVSLRVIPTILLERELMFVRLAILDTLNSVTFYLVATILALAGMGVWALALGVLAQGALGCIAAYFLRPYKPIWVFDGSLVRGLLSFGVPLQVRGALWLGIRAVIPIVVGAKLGSHAVGELNWAWENGFFALTFCDILARVGFPHFSRIRDDRAHLLREVERTVRVGLAICSFLVALFVGLAHPLTATIFGPQWIEAVSALRLCAAAMFLGGFGSLLGPALDAQGFPRLTMFYLGLIGLIEWIAAPILLAQFGINGFAAATCFAYSSGGLLMVFYSRWLFPEMKLLRMFLANGAAVFLVATFGYFVLAPRANAALYLVASVVSLVALFVGLIFLMDRKTLAALVRTLRPQG